MTDIQINHLKPTRKPSLPPSLPGADGLIYPNGYRPPASFKHAVSNLVGKAIIGAFLMGVLVVVLAALITFWGPIISLGGGGIATAALLLWVFHDGDAAKKSDINRIIRKLDEEKSDSLTRLDPSLTVKNVGRSNRQ